MRLWPHGVSVEHRLVRQASQQTPQVTQTAVSAFPPFITFISSSGMLSTSVPPLTEVKGRDSLRLISIY